MNDRRLITALVLVVLATIQMAAMARTDTWSRYQIGAGGLSCELRPVYGFRHYSIRHSGKRVGEVFRLLSTLEDAGKINRNPFLAEVNSETIPRIILA